jgi:signal transduction histidine kinase
MRERASGLGGSFEINSELGIGTRVEVYIPYNGKTEESTDEDALIAS